MLLRGGLRVPRADAVARPGRFGVLPAAAGGFSCAAAFESHLWAENVRIAAPRGAAAHRIVRVMGAARAARAAIGEPLGAAPACSIVGASFCHPAETARTGDGGRGGTCAVCGCGTARALAIWGCLRVGRFFGLRPYGPTYLGTAKAPPTFWMQALFQSRVRGGLSSHVRTCRPGHTAYLGVGGFGGHIPARPRVLVRGASAVGVGGVLGLGALSVGRGVGVRRPAKRCGGLHGFSVRSLGGGGGGLWRCGGFGLARAPHSMLCLGEEAPQAKGRQGPTTPQGAP